MIKAALITLVKGYRLLLSPWLGSSCRFEPTCSAYGLEALERFGAAGLDPVPGATSAGLFTRHISMSHRKKSS